MKWQGIAGQTGPHPLYRADGTITTGGTAQLGLCASPSRSKLIAQNLSLVAPLYLEFGAGRATAVLTAGVVTSVTINNAGFGFTIPPQVFFLGGGGLGGPTGVIGANQPNGPSPQNVATGLATLSAGAISGVTVTNGGSGYQKPPYVLLLNDPRDPYGCSIPSATSGILLPASSPPLVFNGSALTTDAIALFGSTTGMPFMLGWMD